jgi:hypothetical protein
MAYSCSEFIFQKKKNIVNPRLFRRPLANTILLRSNILYTQHSTHQLIFMGKTGVKPSQQRRESTTNSTYVQSLEIDAVRDNALPADAAPAWNKCITLLSKWFLPF